MRQRRLRGVQHAHLDLLVRLRVGDERGPGKVQRRSLAGELVLDDPLPERLANDRAGVARAERLGDFVDVFRRGRRHDPVDHRRWKRDPLLDQARQLRRPQSRKLEHRRAEPRAVGWNIVAADQSERRPPGLSSPLERKRQQAKEGARREAAVEVRAKRGIVEIERAGRRRQAIAFFGHGDRRDGNVGAAERGDGAFRARLVRNVDHVAQRADDAGLSAGVLPERAGIKTILRGQEIGEAWRREVHTHDAPSSEASLEHVVNEFGLVTAMKSADADMRHADLQALAIVLRLAHRRRQLRQKAARQASHRLGLSPVRQRRSAYNRSARRTSAPRRQREGTGRAARRRPGSASARTACLRRPRPAIPRLCRA